MGIAVGVLSGVIAAAIWAAVTQLVRRGRERRGFLAGWWWQITYPPVSGATVIPVSSEAEAANGSAEVLFRDPMEHSAWSLADPDDSPWSIELLYIRQRNEIFSGEAWRVYREHPERRWVSSGRCGNDSIVDGIYWANRGEGGHGTFHLWAFIGSSRYCGEFSESKVQLGPSGPRFEFSSAPLEWVRVGSDEEAKVLSWLRRAVPQKLDSSWPRRVQRKICLACGIPDSPSHFGWLRYFGYAPTVYGDPFVALALEAQRRSQRNREPSDTEDGPVDK